MGRLKVDVEDTPMGKRFDGTQNWLFTNRVIKLTCMKLKPMFKEKTRHFIKISKLSRKEFREYLLAEMKELKIEQDLLKGIK